MVTGSNPVGVTTKLSYMYLIIDEFKETYTVDRLNDDNLLPFYDGLIVCIVDFETRKKLSFESRPGNLIWEEIENKQPEYEKEKEG